MLGHTISTDDGKISVPASGADDDILSQGEFNQINPPMSEEIEIFSTEDELRMATVAENDPFLLAEKYTGQKNIPFMLKTPPLAYQNGATRDFWVLNVDSNDYHQINAYLAYQTSHIYFWVEKGIQYSLSDLKKLSDTFENQIYPRNRSIFGKEFSPGVDNDEHLTILYAEKLGGAAGYFSSADSFVPAIEKYSNKTEMFYLSADHISLSNDYIYGVMAHEFQHMIHWNVDRDEEGWVNEGLSELAVDLNGFDLGGFTSLFIFNPDLQLNFWPGSSQGNSAPHYGASYLFVKYLYDQFGEKFISNLVSQQKNGFFGLDELLGVDEIGGEENSEEIFQNWSIANYLDDVDLANGIYGYDLSQVGTTVTPTNTMSCGDENYSESVNQFGTDYSFISCERDYEVAITWNETTPLLEIDPHSGDYYFWSNRGDESSMRLSREFDLSMADQPIELSYWTWYDIETDYDYLYVNIFTNGEWQNLQTTSCTNDNPTGANFGCGYNGKSAGWLEEKIDLSQYAGQHILLEFEYVTDAAVNGEGLVLDDMRIDAIAYAENFEGGDGGWESEGFVRIKNELPQAFSAAIVNSDKESVVLKEIAAAGSEIRFVVNNQDVQRDEVLILSGLSRFTHLPAAYKVVITQITN